MTDTPNPRRTESLLKPIARWFGDRILRVLFRIIPRVPEQALPSWGAALGRLFFVVSRRHRNLALWNLRKVYPELPEEAIRRLARQVFINFGKAGMEFLRIPFMHGEEIDRRVHLEAREHLDAGLARGKGVILFTAHFGNWELLSCKLLCEGYPLDAIARNARHASTTHLMTDIRQKHGMRIIPRGAMLAAVRALKSNRILGILADQNDFRGIQLDFLGHPAYTSTGPATLALMTGAVIVPVFAVRQPDDTIVATCHPPIIPVDTGDRQRDIRELTEQTVRILEMQIREAPEQWLWFHGRWKVPPSPQVPAGV